MKILTYDKIPKDMKILTTLFAMMLYAVPALSQGDSYTIRGVAEGTVDGDTVYLCKLASLFSIKRIDSTKVAGGEYLFKGSYPGCGVHYVMTYRNGSYKGLTAIMLENADIQIHSFPADSKKEAIVSGGPNHMLWKEYKSIQKKWQDKKLPYWKTTQDSTVARRAQMLAQKAIDSLSVLQNDESFDFMMEHLPAPFSNLVLGEIFTSLPQEKKEVALRAFKEKYPEASNLKQMAAETNTNEAGAVGKTFTDFSMADVDGNPVSVGSFVKKNRYTLVDFWASWCGPCRAEMPYVVEAYEKYHNKGLEVVGISLDNKADAWKEAIGKLKLPWPQLSDLQGWKSLGADIYHIKAIPANILIDSNGVIVAKNLRGLTLLYKIDELLN